MHPFNPSSRSPQEVLDSVEPTAGLAPSPETSFGRLVLQDWHPVVGSLEWVLGNRFWEQQGLDAFVRGEVPYVINNTAWVAESAAAVLLASCEGLDRTAPVRALELGAGLGLFARQVLDCIRQSSERDGHDVYERLTFYVTDGSRRTVERWIETGLFAAHSPHVVLAVCDAEAPDELEVIPHADPPPPQEPGGHSGGPNARTPGEASLLASPQPPPASRQPPPPASRERILVPSAGLQAVFANYVMDSLPATILRRRTDPTKLASISPDPAPPLAGNEHAAAGSARATNASDERAGGPAETAVSARGAAPQWVSTGFEELRVRTHISEVHREEIRRRFGTQWEELSTLGRIAATPGRTSESHPRSAEIEHARDVLLCLLPYFEFEVDYGTVATLEALPVPPEVEASSATRMVWNYGAFRAVDRILKLLGDDGFLLARDLGPAVEAKTADLSYVARFGPSLAFTIAFPLLDAFVARRGAQSISPEGDSERNIHTRLIRLNGGVASETDRIVEVFRERFESDQHTRADGLSEEATRHINAGRYSEALRCYREALELCPNDWNVLGQTAQFLSQQLLRPAEATELVERALTIQPNFSSFLWNTLGNCRFYLGDHESAHEYYLRARTIHPCDSQSELNLAYTFTAFGQLEEALQSIARGLAFDRDERFEAALLAKQKEIVAAIQKRRQEEEGRADRRHHAFSSAR